jgi:hypothetical protein
VRKDYYGVGGTPTVYFNGGGRIVGSNPPPYDRYRTAIEGLLTEEAQILVKPSLVPLEAKVGATVSIELEIAQGETIENPEECRVRALIYEDEVASGEIYNHVVRSVPVDIALPISDSGQMTTIDREIDLDTSWKLEDLYIVAWVQREAGKEILNAAVRKLSDPMPVAKTTWGAMKAAFR